MTALSDAALADVPLGQYMRALNVTEPGRKTHIFRIEDRRGGLLGRVMWYGAWRQYAFFPVDEPVFNADCLTHIAAFCARLMAERREVRRAS